MTEIQLKTDTHYPIRAMSEAIPMTKGGQCLLRHRSQ